MVFLLHFGGKLMLQAEDISYVPAVHRLFFLARGNNQEFFFGSDVVIYWLPQVNLG